MANDLQQLITLHHNPITLVLFMSGEVMCEYMCVLLNEMFIIIEMFCL